MTAPLNPLQRLIAKRLDYLGWSLREVERQSEGAISASSLSLIMTGKTQRPDPRWLTMLAGTLDIPADQLRDAAALSADAKAQRQLPARAAQLTPKGYRQLIRFLDFLLEVERDS